MSTVLEGGMVLGSKWEILRPVARGGKGELYLARQINLDREVVVKIISSDYLVEFVDDREEIRTTINQFHREARAMAQVRHPNVVQVHDKDSTVIDQKNTELAVPYVVMEYVPGPTLRSTMPPNGFGEDEQGIRDWIRSYFLPILDGIETIHKRGIVHRDIKPENVLIDDGSNPKIADFGIAGGDRWQQLTRSRDVEGTILYMAPEQFLDLGESDVRADVYSLGKILCEALCGNMAQKKTAVPMRTVCLPNPATPFLKRLDQIIRLSTAEDKERRIPSVRDLRQRLENLLNASVEVSSAPVPGSLESFYLNGLQNSSFGKFLQAPEKADREDKDRFRQRTRELLEVNAQLKREIRDRERTEEMLRAKIGALEDSNKGLEEFAHAAAHDLREPLVGIAAYLKALERRCKGRLDSEANKLVSRALEITLRMDSLVQSLLAYSRLGAGPKSLQSTDCNVALQSALSNLKSAVEEASAKVITDPLPTVMGDPALMVQLFQNLVSNAIKFAGDRPLEIHIGATQGESEWQFFVKDNGIGIEPPYFDRIFRIFQRLEASSERPGTGIGLASCKRIVEHHGGRIWVESEPGKGSTFYFTVPVPARGPRNVPCSDSKADPSRGPNSG